MNKTKKLTLSALFIALGILLPFVTGQIPSFGNLLLPMHIPALLCGFVCGNPYGLLVGGIIPILRSLLLGRPAMMPTALAMAVELATYGAVSGLLYARFKNKKAGIYLSLIPAMLAGRITWGITSLILYRIMGNPFTWKYFVAESFINATPGILVQIILIPAIMYAVKRAKLLEPSGN